MSRPGGAVVRWHCRSEQTDHEILRRLSQRRFILMRRTAIALFVVLSDPFVL